MRLALALACLGVVTLATGISCPAAADPPRVHRIRFEGAQQISPSQLRSAMHLRQRSWWQPFRKNFFYGTDHLEPDLERIVALYQGEGFVLARVEEALVRYLSRDWVEIEIRVDEGPQFCVRRVGMDGVEGGLRQQLRAEIRIAPGESLQEPRLRGDERRLLRVCREAGYALAEVTRELRLQGDSAAVFYLLELGPLVRVGEIHAEGHQQTAGEVILREVVVEEGEVFRLSRAVRTQERLFDLDLFRSVRIHPTYRDSIWAEGRLDHVRVDLGVEVREKPPGWYGLGFGYSSRDRVRLLGEWGYRNLRGRARSLQATAEIAYSLVEEPADRFRQPKEWEVELIYAAPWLLHTPTRWQIRAYYQFKRWFEEQLALDEDIVGAVFLARWDLSRYRRLVGSIENKWTTTDRTFVTRFLSLRFSEDRRDFILNPHRGHFAQVQTEYAGRFLGGETDFTRWKVSFSGYVPLGGRFTWAHRARVGYLHPVGRSRGETTPLERVPIDERFFAGGGTSVRGYSEESLGPRVEGQSQGGLALILLNAELRFQLFWELGAAIFLDAGNVWADYRQIKWSRWGRGWTRASFSELDVAYGLGTGLRLMTPVGPLRLDYAMKVGRGYRSISARDYEWHFSLGQAF